MITEKQGLSARMTKTVRHSHRFSVEVLEKIQALADQENRSLTNMVDTLLLEALAARDQGNVPIWAGP